MNVIHKESGTEDVHATLMLGFFLKQKPFSHVPLKAANDTRGIIFTNIVFKSRVLLQQKFFYDEENVYITNTQLKQDGPIITL